MHLLLLLQALESLHSDCLRIIKYLNGCELFGPPVALIM